MTERTKKAIERVMEVLNKDGRIECDDYLCGSLFGVSIGTIRKYLPLKLVVETGSDENIDYVVLHGWNEAVAEIFKNRHTADDYQLIDLIEAIEDNFLIESSYDTVENCNTLQLFMDLRYLSDEDFLREWNDWYLRAIDNIGKLVIKNNELMVERRYYTKRYYFVKD